MAHSEYFPEACVFILLGCTITKGPFNVFSATHCPAAVRCWHDFVSENNGAVIACAMLSAGFRFVDLVRQKSKDRDKYLGELNS